MAYSPRDDDVVTLPVSFCFFANPEDIGQVLGNTWFLSNDDDGHEKKAQRRLYLNPPFSLECSSRTHEMFHFMSAFLPS